MQCYQNISILHSLFKHRNKYTRAHQFLIYHFQSLGEKHLLFTGDFFQMHFISALFNLYVKEQWKEELVLQDAT